MVMASMLQIYLIVGILFFLPKGCAPILRGPAAVSGYLGRLLSVTCQYNEGYQTYYKYWCRGTWWNSCNVVVKTTGTEEGMNAGRTSIKDNHAHSEFTVQLHNLTQQDAGIYWCAIDRAAASDPHVHIQITALPEPTTTTAVTTGSVSTVSSTMPSSSTSLANKNASSLLMILLPVVFLVLVAFLVGALLLMWRLKKQKAAKSSGEILLSMAATSTGNDVFNAAVKPTPKLSQKPAPPCSDQATNNMAEVEYADVKKASNFTPGLQVPTNTAEGVSYATLRFPAQNEQAIYANVE